MNLARIGYLDLLPSLYGEVIIPPAVFREITERGKSRPGVREIQSASWIRVHPIGNPDRVITLLQVLDPGEAETITLCEELHQQTLLLDERKARRIATEIGLKPLGLLAVLAEAKHRHLITHIRPLLDALRYEAGFRVSTQLYHLILTQAGEDDLHR